MSSHVALDGHVQLGFAAMINAAEIAQIQGVDLYALEKERIVKGLEFAAGFLNGKSPDGICQGHAIALADGTEQPSPMPMWEIAHNHYAGRLGMSLPETKQLVAATRKSPPGSTSSSGELLDRGVYLHMTWETLTHGDVGNAGRQGM